ncbi:MAG TPA: hypothetical protein VGR27_12875 [Longimicrobiaceae bacterium]|nr:hypothetical protein [Longimicrobiaceae bacterium]
MNVDSILLSDYAQLDSGGKLTVVGVFNHIARDMAPVSHPQMALSVVVHGHSEEAGTRHTLEIRLLNQRRELVTPEPITAEFALPGASPPGLPLRNVTVLNVMQPVFPELGAYAFEIYIDGTYHAGVALYVGPKG